MEYFGSVSCKEIRRNGQRKKINSVTQEIESKIKRIKLTKKIQEVFHWEGQTKHANTKKYYKTEKRRDLDLKADR